MANPNPTPKPENLKPYKKGHQTHAEAVEKGSKGGKISGEKYREQVFISKNIKKFLEKEYIDDGKKVTGSDLMEKSWVNIFKKGGVPSVSLTKVMSEATEGSKVKVEIPNTEKIDDKLNKIASEIIDEVNDQSQNP